MSSSKTNSNEIAFAFAGNAGDANSPSESPTVDQIVALCSHAQAIGIVGIHRLTIETARIAIKLGQRLGAKIFIQGADQPAVRQDTTVAWLASADLVIGVGEQTLAAPAIAMPDTLRAVEQLRAQLAEDSNENLIANQIKNATRICIAINPDCPNHVASQWHALAGALQTTTRVGVLQQPTNDARNLRGALEVLTWLTGCSASTGGVDLSRTPAVNCADLPAHLERGAIDLLICFGQATQLTDDRCKVITLPCLTSGQAGSVMRFDGTTFSLAGKDVDATLELIKQLTERLADR